MSNIRPPTEQTSQPPCYTPRTKHPQPMAFRKKDQQPVRVFEDWVGGGWGGSESSQG